MNDSQLDQLLKDACPPVAPPQDFQRDVWLRIAATETIGWKPRVALILERFLGVFTLPPVAVATCTAMVALGAWCGLQSDHPTPSGDVTYIQSVSPFAHHR